MTTSLDIEEFSRVRMPDSACDAAFSSWNDVLQGLIDLKDPATVLEVGGGRSPSFVNFRSKSELIVNDVSAEELALLPAGMRRAQFDISQPAGIPQEFKNCVDLLFSRSVLEHVSSADEAMRSTFELLKPGGVALHFFPTLYASPFVINKLIPFHLTKPLVEFFARPEYERFPALYRQCSATQRRLDLWKSFGFRQIHAKRFYGHHYYRNIPVLNTLTRHYTDWCIRRDFSFSSSFVYLFAIK